ncbi:MAG: hypothetical protein V3V12_07665 [Gammaproteobacteria bacterium]
MGSLIDTKFTMPVQPVKPGYGIGEDDRTHAKRVGEKPKHSSQKKKQMRHRKDDDHIDEFA